MLHRLRERSIAGQYLTARSAPNQHARHHPDAVPFLPLVINCGRMLIKHHANNQLAGEYSTFGCCGSSLARLQPAIDSEHVIESLHSSVAPARTGPRNGIERSTFQPGCRRAATIIAAFAFGLSSSSTSSCVSSDVARTRAPPSSFASHCFRCELRYTDTPGVGIARARNVALIRSITRVESSTRLL